MPEYKFIPRSELEIERPKTSYNGLIITVSFVIFFVSCAVYGAAFLYNFYLDKQIKIYNSTFEKIKSEIEIKSIIEVLDKSREIETAKTLLSKHTASSHIFGVIEEDTVKSNYYTSFSFGDTAGVEQKSSGFKVVLAGVAKNYEELAKQMDAIKSSANFEEAKFSSFKLLDDGDVSYSLDLKTKGQILNY